MNKFKKVGLTALAGTLASVSAINAGELAVSGGAMVTYVSQDGSEVTGNPFGMKSNVAFTGSGEMDNGWGVTFYTNSADKFGGQTSGSLTVDMGDMGKVALDQGTGMGLWAMRDKLPRVGEESWDSLDSADGMVGFGGSSGKLAYMNSMADVNYTVSYMNQGVAANADGVGSSGGDGSSWDISGDMSPMDGVTVYAGYGKRSPVDESGTNDDDVQATLAATYAVGMVTIGAQRSNIDEGDTNGATQKMTGLGIAVNVNENLSISWNERETTFDNATAADVDAKSEGIGLAYTMGSMSLTTQINKGTNMGGVSALCSAGRTSCCPRTACRPSTVCRMATTRRSRPVERTWTPSTPPSLNYQPRASRYSSPPEIKECGAARALARSTTPTFRPEALMSRPSEVRTSRRRARSARRRRGPMVGVASPTTLRGRSGRMITSRSI
jgi:outer membrane protein OmpU